MKIFYFLLVSLLVISCTGDDDASNTSFEINGRFIHQIPSCNNDGNFEINCVEFIE